jgi:hypothetical protein
MGEKLGDFKKQGENRFFIQNQIPNPSSNSISNSGDSVSYLMFIWTMQEGHAKYLYVTPLSVLLSLFGREGGAGGVVETLRRGQSEHHPFCKRVVAYCMSLLFAYRTRSDIPLV